MNGARGASRGMNGVGAGEGRLAWPGLGWEAAAARARSPPPPPGPRPPPTVPVDVPDAPAPGPQGRPAGREGRLLLLLLLAPAAVVAGHGAAAAPRLPAAAAAAAAVGPSHILGARGGMGRRARGAAAAALAAAAAAAGRLHHTHIMAPRERAGGGERAGGRAGGRGRAGRPALFLGSRSPPSPTPPPERAGERTPTSRHACLTPCAHRRCRGTAGSWQAGWLAQGARPLSVCKEPGPERRGGAIRGRAAHTGEEMRH